MPDDPATLLLVEDDPLIRTFLADNLTADGYELLLADTLRDGLRVLEHHRPDLAVIDLALPDRRADQRPARSHFLSRGGRRFPVCPYEGHVRRSRHAPARRG